MPSQCLKVIVLWLSVLAPSLSHAQLLQVDIDGSTTAQNLTAPGFASWRVGSDLSSATANRVATHVFTNAANQLISCTIAQTAPAVADATIYLKAGWLNKDGITYGYKLAFDGVWVHQKNTTLDQPYTNGGAMSLTISNLSAGVHTITTYHNDLWGTNTGQTWIDPSNPYLSRCIVSVNGSPVFTCTPSFIVTNDLICGFAYFSVTNDYDGQPVVINFDPDHSSYADFVVLNGFVIDGPAPGTTASQPTPANGDEHVFANNDGPLPGTANSGYLTLGWVSSAFALTNEMYFGTNNSAVAAATHTSPEFKGAVSATVTNWDVTNLNSSLTYYWRVDSLDAVNGGTNMVAGTVWSFRPRHLAFPGAEGYGRWARGGRGGVVLEVTNLNDSGPGSYRAAISASGPRTVVFRVSGLIRLQSPCIIGNGYLTIAGQTAPGDGICIANWRAGMSGPTDVIMRYMRFRVGDGAQQSMDAMSLGSATHTIVDHCSSSWSLDVACNSLQGGGVGSASAMTTYQRNIISEPLRYSYHYNDAERQATGCTNCYQPHGFAASISGEIGSYHHNLIAHSTDRNWSLAGGLDQSSHYAGSLDIRNNVVYNWLNGRTTDGGEARLNYVNNYYKPYPANPYATWLLKLDTINTNWGTEYIYMTGNVMEGKNYYANNWSASSFYNGLPLTGLVTNDTELYPSYVTTQSATNAYKVVLSDVGCNLPAQDLTDRRIIGEVLDGTTHYEGTNGPSYTINGILQDTAGPDNPGFIDSQTDVHDYSPVVGTPNYSENYPWAPYDTYNVPIDSDHDGMPDWWELAKGLNPNSAPGDYSDSNGDPDGDGYSNLEDYLNWLAAIHTDCARNSHVDVDLTGFTRGFTNLSPVYAVFSANNGVVGLLSGGTVARFTPTAGFHGLGGFQFKVTDSSGFSYTNTVGIHVRANAQSQLAFSAPGGLPALQFTGESGFYFLLQYSDDLVNWTTWTNVTGTVSAQNFTPPGFPHPSARFYRAVSVQ